MGSAHRAELERNTYSEQHNCIAMNFCDKEMNAPPVVRTNSDQRNGGDCGDDAEMNMNAPPVTRTNSDQRNGGDCGDGAEMNMSPPPVTRTGIDERNGGGCGDD